LNQNELIRITTNHHQNLTTFKLSQVKEKISVKDACNFLRNRANKQTKGQTNKRRIWHNLLSGGNNNNSWLAGLLSSLLSALHWAMRSYLLYGRCVLLKDVTRHRDRSIIA